MVGSENDRDRRRIARGGQHRADHDGHRRIAPQRLEHDVAFDAAFAHLLGGDEAEIGVGDDDRAVELGVVAQALQHLRKRRALIDQRHELLGHALARHRP